MVCASEQLIYEHLFKKNKHINRKKIFWTSQVHLSIHSAIQPRYFLQIITGMVILVGTLLCSCLLLESEIKGILYSISSITVRFAFPFYITTTYPTTYVQTDRNEKLLLAFLPSSIFIKLLAYQHFGGINKSTVVSIHLINCQLLLMLASILTCRVCRKPAKCSMLAL